jgi:hypothetical protein
MGLCSPQSSVNALIIAAPTGPTGQPRLVAKMETKNNHGYNKKKILIVDNEVDITFTFKIGLEDTGLFTVDTFNDPQNRYLISNPACMISC